MHFTKCWKLYSLKPFSYIYNITICCLGHLANHHDDNHHENYHDFFPNITIYEKYYIRFSYGYGERGTALDHTSILFIKPQFYCGRFTALQNWTILFHKISVDLMLNCPNLLYRYRKFILPSAMFLCLKRT